MQNDSPNVVRPLEFSTGQSRQDQQAINDPSQAAADHIRTLLAYIDTTWDEEDGLPKPERAKTVRPFLAGPRRP